MRHGLGGGAAVDGVHPVRGGYYTKLSADSMRGLPTWLCVP